jgi:type II secretory ATPase GspE/PulE/Tfp pilus assembly ATPase PilB-like protein
MAPDNRKSDVGDVLVQNGLLTDKHLESARRRQVRLRIPLHRALTDLNYATEEDTYRALATLHNLEFVDLSAIELNKALLQSVPVKLALHYRMVPISQEAGLITIACSEVPPLGEQGNLRLLLAKRIKFVITTPSSVHAIIKKHYGLGADTIQQLRQDRTSRDVTQEVVFDLKAGEPSTTVEASISDFVDQILLEALRLDATDVHFEPYPNNVRLRYRVDGILQEIPVPTDLRQVYDYIISRIKVMAGLNIAERRLPHDGRIAMKTETEEYALRVSIIPTKYGEAACLRILGRQSLFLDLSQLGMDPDQQVTMEQLTQLSQGMVLITGPTGSGKTTTLYAALAHANDVGRKIITIENPVEYQLEGIMQIQTHEEIGLTFSNGLRSVLRHDPDVVLIGEIRDTETAEIAIRAAQTGHLVFSTLHTNDSISAITRLLEMRIEPFLVGSSLVCSIAQRLARRVCRHCRQLDPNIPDSIRQEMTLALNLPPEKVQAWIGTGCLECSQNGYRGRVALYEFFIMNEEICDMLLENIPTQKLRETASRFGWQPLRAFGWSKVQSGLISIAEQQRLTLRVSNLAVA